ncbi:hypothetical protein AVENP_0996 [Arcobacter venerupis]|uniref:Uncharacterized protein n=1 Tax=Arcobacter venerupis TaxID=1054033 RepID=A0AAE7BAA2_9BACT|nr:hypothetical protein [Arcobacter venerupis]QKF66552.1 hypothetical protein AVENP_0996 [Arcobacter venerupis]RWS49711.1 hypothetical protein CKA56_08300 [Arcobacter venerupis]
MSKCKETVAYLKEKNLKELLERLNTIGIISEDVKNEDNEFIISGFYIKYWCKEASNYFKAQGYNGGELMALGKFDEIYGNFMVLFDQDKYEINEVRSYIEKILNKYKE